MTNGDNISVLLDTVKATRPTFPFFVVITIAPLDALLPYNAAAAAPDKTDIDSMSSGFISAIASVEPCDCISSEPPEALRLYIGIPSIT